jgi:DNA mismatch endonuclease (patch repair protein)
MFVRRLVTKLGYRYRLHTKDLPGKPDLVFRSRKRAIFVHGCFWHLHSECREGRVPNTKAGYWAPKLLRNVERDKLHLEKLEEDGWRVMVIWECELADATLTDRISTFLE